MSGNLCAEDDVQISDSLIERLKLQNGSDKLDLTLCNITKIPVAEINFYFGKPRPMDLDLSYNAIYHVSQKFVLSMVHVTKLDLSKNKIRKLPDNFGVMDQLMYLDLHQNQLETLPLSMGNMTRLTFLSISSNPFRSPLKEFLEKLGTNISGLAMASLMVTFLQEVSTELDVSTTHATRAPRIGTGNTRRSKAHYRRIASVTKDDRVSDDDSIYSDSDEENLMKKQKSFLSSFAWGISKTVLVMVLWSALIPILIAYIAETSFMEHMARNYPTFDMIWTDYKYKNVHEIAVSVASIFPRQPAWVLKGPPATQTIVLGYLTSIWMSIKTVFKGMWGIVGITI